MQKKGRSKRLGEENARRDGRTITRVCSETGILLGNTFTLEHQDVQTPIWTALPPIHILSQICCYQSGTGHERLPNPGIVVSILMNGETKAVDQGRLRKTVQPLGVLRHTFNPILRGQGRRALSSRKEKTHKSANGRTTWAL